MILNTLFKVFTLIGSFQGIFARSREFWLLLTWLSPVIAHWEAYQWNPHLTWKWAFLDSWSNWSKMLSKPCWKLRGNWKGLCNKECCPPPSSTSIKSLVTAVTDLQSTLKGIQGEDNHVALSALGKLAEPALRYLCIFRRIFYKHGTLHLPILRKAPKWLAMVSGPFEK